MINLNDGFEIGSLLKTKKIMYVDFAGFGKKIHLISRHPFVKLKNLNLLYHVISYAG